MRRLPLYAFHVILWKRALWQREPLHGFSHGERASERGQAALISSWISITMRRLCLAARPSERNCKTAPRPRDGGLSMWGCRRPGVQSGEEPATRARSNPLSRDCAQISSERATDRARGSRDVTRAFLTFLQIWHSVSQAAWRWSGAGRGKRADRHDDDQGGGGGCGMVRDHRNQIREPAPQPPPQRPQRGVLLLLHCAF